VSDRPTIVLATSELMLQSRLNESLRQLGYKVLIGDSSETLTNALGEDPEAVILDLQSLSEPLELIDRAKQAGVPVLAYGQHTKANVLRQAREAGASVAVPRSELVEDLQGLLAKLSR
jgi:DNA-binding response OmpR family regulator